jgi:SAM-dependent methyltransferase
MAKVKYRSSFPGEDLLNPKLYQSGFLFTKSLLNALSSAVKTNLNNKSSVGGGVKIIDIACGSKPYYPLFQNIASEYIGIDINDSIYADKKADAAELPFPDRSFDVALSTQALEHIREYQSAVDEMHRVLKNDGIAFLSTHGVMEVHGAPHDYWRFTQYGLKEVFKNFKEVVIINNGGAILCLFMILNTYIRRLDNIPVINLFAKLIIIANNIIGWYLDKLFNKYDFYVTNYLVVAKK